MLALELATDLHDHGNNVSIIASNGTMPVFQKASMEVYGVSDERFGLSELYLQSLIEDRSPDAIILCDIHSCDRFLHNDSGSLRSLLDNGIPTVAMDIWQCQSGYREIDHVGDLAVNGTRWLDGLAGRLVPVPIGRTTSLGAYCAMAEPVKIARSVRNHIRQNLGLGDTDRAVLFCTAGWQHGLNNADGQRLATATPPLLWRYLEAVDPSVRLIHVGPARLNLPDAGTRYLWMPSVAPDDFGRLLASVDLFLSANVSATTVGRAVACGIPTVIVQNSIRARTVMEVEEALSGPLHPIVRTWLNDALPVYPFRLWPLGYWHFLEPLLQENPYTTAIETVELLMGDAVIESCHRLLFDQSYIAEFKVRQARYDELVRKLPSAAQLIDTYLR